MSAVAAARRPRQQFKLARRYGRPEVFGRLMDISTPFSGDCGKSH
jgi:hypothetical protein